MLGGQKCPWCGHYNPLDDRRCGKCERWVPPPPIAGWVASFNEISLPVTKLVVALNAMVFAGELAASRSKDLPLFSNVSVSALMRFGALHDTLHTHEPWRFVTANFVHMSILHIAMNMMSAVNLGQSLEPSIGSGRFALSYLFTGVCGFVLSAWWTGDAPVLTAGASASVFGLVGMLLSILIIKKDPNWKDMLIRVVGWSVVIAFAVRVNNAAHIGGALSGALLGAVFSRETRPWKITPYVNVAAIIAIVATVVCLILPTQSPAWKRAREAEEWQRQQRELDRLLPDSW